MAVHVVVPEGLASRSDLEAIVLSPHFQAVLDRVARLAGTGDRVYMSPGNAFGNEVPEEAVAADRLRTLRPDLDVVVPDRPDTGGYLDTLDNARELRFWLRRTGAWPLPPIRLYCYGVHGYRSRRVFQWTGYTVERLETAWGAAPVPKPTNRLWYMGVPVAHDAYEALAFVYDWARALAENLGGAR
jgi:hypothetical protein